MYLNIESVVFGSKSNRLAILGDNEYRHQVTLIMEATDHEEIMNNFFQEEFEEGFGVKPKVVTKMLETGKCIVVYTLNLDSPLRNPSSFLRAQARKMEKVIRAAWGNLMNEWSLSMDEE